MVQGLEFGRAEVNNNMAIIKLTMFGDLINQEKSSYNISYLRVAKYDYEWYLNIRESSTVSIQCDLNTELTDIDKKEVEKKSTNIKVTVQVTSLDPRLFCSNCNKDITPDEEFVIYKKCDTMSLISNCKTNTAVKFTGQITNDKVLLGTDCLILSEHFKLTAKLELVKVC